ncbi:MAG TPA: hypothetical protein VFM31_01915 [Nitrososphaeraceae archaeon]|jgi:hypothetical protein|nr:hypothetical protein [Nitrososphaeraceae archaeon]HJT83632.1 hypothetical protein [Nitrososphaeraceae archaeon]
MTLVPLNNYELDFIISILKYYKIRITEEIRQQPSEKDLEDRHYTNMIQNMMNKLKKYMVEEMDSAESKQEMMKE